MILYLGHFGLNLSPDIEVKNGITVTRWDSGISLFHPKLWIQLYRMILSDYRTTGTIPYYSYHNPFSFIHYHGTLDLIWPLYLDGHMITKWCDIGLVMIYFWFATGVLLSIDQKWDVNMI